MNQNTNGTFTKYLVLFAFTLAFVWLHFPELTVGPRCDSLMIAKEINLPISEWSKTTDHHEPLFLYEARFLWQIVHHLFPQSHTLVSVLAKSCGANPDLVDKIGKSALLSRSSYQLVYIIWFGTTLMMYTMMCSLICSMMRRVRIACFFIGFLALSFIFIRNYNYALFYKYLDSYFYAHIISAVIGVRFFLESQEKKRYLWLGFILFCLFHCVGYRRVAILTLPLFFYGITSAYTKLRNIKIRIATSFFLAVVFALGSKGLTALLPTQHTHSASVMLYSDMHIASLLSGDKETFHQICDDVGISGDNIEHVHHTQETIHQSYYLLREKADTEENWNKLLFAYADYFKKHPKEMLLGRVISITQFYSNYCVPDFEKKWILSCCPEAKLSENSWKATHINLFETGGRYEKVYLFSIAAVLLTFILFKYRLLDAEMRFFVFVSILGFVYSLSYCLVVVPTPDPRFHAFPVFAQCMFLSYVAARCCDFALRGIKNRVQGGSPKH